MESGLDGPGLIELLGGASAVVVESVGADLSELHGPTRLPRPGEGGSPSRRHAGGTRARQQRPPARCRLYNLSVRACDHGFKGRDRAGGADRDGSTPRSSRTTSKDGRYARSPESTVATSRRGGSRPAEPAQLPPSTGRRTPPPPGRIGQDPATSPRPNSGPGRRRAPAIGADDGDDAVARRQAPERTRHDADDRLVELVEHVLRTAVAGIAATVGDPRDHDRGIAHAERDAGVVHRPELAASDDQREPTGDVRHEAISAGQPRCAARPPSGSARCAPPPRGRQRARATSQASARAPTIRHLAGSDSREYSSSRGLSIRVWVGPRRELTAGDIERLVDGVQAAPAR